MAGYWRDEERRWRDRDRDVWPDDSEWRRTRDSRDFGRDRDWSSGADTGRFGMEDERYGRTGEGYGRGYSGPNHGREGYGQSGWRHGSSSWNDTDDWRNRRASGGYDFGGPGPSSSWGYGSGDYGRDSGYARRGQDRGFWERASDEVSSWFGDEDAERRRRMDQREGGHRGRGPKGYVRSDERIREDVSDALSEDFMVDASEIEVSVSGAEVTLSGSVDSRQARRRAEDCAERVLGVTHVQNNLRVKGAASTFGGDTTGATGTSTPASQTTTAPTLSSGARGRS
jgi:osmotically-inducible protein OsmY